ncbi:MAG: hypothetical protein M3362_19265 [Acidobacteriota bacterium]|nr:hypothetical protein [Acidobacteriota bacterium]
MPEDDKTDNNPQEADNKDERAAVTNARSDRFPIGLRLILFSCGGALVILLIVSIIHPYMTERVKFFTVNALSILVLAVILVQAYIYRRQWEAMQGQLDAMKDQAATMREQVELATKQVEAINISERAYIGIETVGLSNLEVGKVPRIVMIIKNAGRTPAKKVKAPGRINIELAGKRPQEEITKSRYIGDGTLAANAIRHCVYEFIGICDENMLYQITSRNWMVFFQGAIWYEDVWGNEWNESFFLEWDNSQQAFLDRREKIEGDKERNNPNQSPNTD